MGITALLFVAYANADNSVAQCGSLKGEMKRKVEGRAERETDTAIDDAVDEGFDKATDSQGDDTYNQELSQKRAAVVNAHLCNKYGIAPDRLDTTRLGESKPVDSNDTPEGRTE